MMTPLHVCLIFLLSMREAFVVADVDKWPSTEEDHSILQVVVPTKLTKKGGYPHKDALFGYPTYSTGSVQTQLILAKEKGCGKFNTDGWEGPFALMITRGDCHFVEKVRNAQHAGARAVIIADDKCLCTDQECMASTGDTVCEAVLPYMADDESGGDISIPSMLIRKSDAEAIKKELKFENGVSNVMVKFDWGIPSPDGRVEWTMWHSSWDEQSMIALQEMESIVKALGDRAFFSPHFVSYNGSRVGCHSSSDSNPCGNMCLNTGRYCLLDPSPFHDQSVGASGHDVVTENLRRKCIWKEASLSEKGVGKKWWNYVNDFGKICNVDEKTFVDKACSEKLMKKHGIDVSAVEKCMQPYGTSVDKPNPMLEEELKEQTGLELLRLPAVYVDGVHARGRINAVNTLDMICAGYGSHDPPSACQCVSQPQNLIIECLEKGIGNMSQPSQSSGGVGFFGVLLIITMVSSVFAGAAFVYWRRTQLHMREQVRSILAEYMPLEDQSDALDSPRLHPALVASAKSPSGFAPTTSFVDDDEGV